MSSRLMSDGKFVALVIAFSGIVNTLLSLRNGRKTDAVKKEVTTLNAQTIAQLADNAESRRIETVEPLDRTDADRSHMESMK